jgi:hypothetical protein
LESPILPDPRSQRNTYAEFFWEAYYGLEPGLYTELILARWRELTGD